MMLLYRLLFIPAFLLGLPYYAYRMWRRGGYRNSFENRFGVMPNVPPKRENVKRIWIQAVSVGELLAIAPLLRKLDEDPSMEVVLTTTTSTGLRVLREKLAAMTAWNGVFPLDFWPFSRRAWNILQPDLAILMEGELWPEHIFQAWKRKVPVLLANARMSDRSYRRHQSVRNLARPYLCRLDSILASSSTDQERFRHLGWLPANHIHLAGNLKFDVEKGSHPTEAERRSQLTELGFPDTGTMVLLGSSTWPGEEEALLNLYIGLQKDFPQLRLLLVPRHAERKKDLQALLRQFPLRCHFRSDGRMAPDGTEVYLADTTGELKMLTGFADLVFIGKSLPPNTGGQTPLEAAALGKPMLFGPDMSNFRDIARRLTRAGAARMVQTADELGPVVRELLEMPESRQLMGDKANAFIETSRGSTDRLYERIRHTLSRTG